MNTNFNDDGYTPQDDDEVTTKHKELTAKQLARDAREMAAMLAEDTDVAPQQAPKTSSMETDTIIPVNNEVSSEVLTGVPRDSIDHTDVDFTIEDVIDTTPEALRSPVVDLTDIGKQVATNNAVEVPRTLQEIKLAEDAEIEALKRQQKKANEKERRAIYQKQGTKPVWVTLATYKALIRAVLNGANVEEAFTIARKQSGVKLPMADTERLYKFKGNKAELKQALLVLADSDANFKNILKHTMCNKNMLRSKLSIKEVKSMLLELIQLNKFAHKQKQTAERLTDLEASAIESQDMMAKLHARISKLEGELSVEDTIKVAITKAQAVAIAKQLSKQGISSREITKVLLGRGYKVGHVSVSTWLLK